MLQSNCTTIECMGIARWYQNMINRQKNCNEKCLCPCHCDAERDPCCDDELPATFGTYRMRRKVSPSEYRRNKLLAMRGDLRSLHEHLQKHRDLLWNTGRGTYDNAEFDFQIAVECIYKFCKDLLNERLDMEDITRV